jgi:hypothetical protein
MVTNGTDILVQVLFCVRVFTGGQQSVPVLKPYTNDCEYS